MSKQNNKKEFSGKAEQTAYIVSHTHWDREWRYSIWATRLMLLDFMDELIELLENGKYAGFLMDGQVIPILDYLEVCPEMTDRVKALVADGKLLIGPWLLLPDEYPVDGEALVRNLLLGYRRAEELGGVFKAGYTSFGWGQTAQLAQIYAGFDIDTALIGKRVSKQRAPHSEFIWRSPDGSELLSTRFGSFGRSNFFFKLHMEALCGVPVGPMEWLYHWEDGGTAYHRADPQQMEQDHFRLDAPEKWHPEVITPELIDELWQTTDESVIENHRLMMDGVDYLGSQPMLPEMIKRINEVDENPNRKWVHTTLDKFLEIMKNKIDRSALPVVNGELRDGNIGMVTGNALATRLYLKQLNKKAQNLLLRFAEPLAAMANMTGAGYQSRVFEKTWDFLLKAHPHDSINGVTQDVTANEVESRLIEAIDLSESLGNRALQNLISSIDMNDFDDKDILLAVFNPLPYARDEVIEAWVTRPRPEMDKHTLYFEAVLGMQVYDTQGKAVATQWQGYTNEDYQVSELHRRPTAYQTERHRIFFDAGKIPACGYKIFRVAVKDENGPDVANRPSDVAWSDSKARTATILKSPSVMENEFLKLKMNADGTFDLTDKELGKTFSNLNYYEDRGEIGSYWTNERPMFDQVHTSLGCQARIWAEESGPLQATLVSEIKMALPSRSIKKEKSRGDNISDFVIKTAVTLKAGQKQIEVKVDFDNRHHDHYLRAMFPTGLSDAKCVDTGGHFIVDSRPVRPLGPTPESAWPDMATLPQNNFTDISDGKTGLAFLNDSLTEYEVLDNEERTVALSLLRSVRNWICVATVGSSFSSQKGGQCLGEHSIRYAIRAHKGNWQDENIPLKAELFNVPAVPVQTRKHQGKLPTDETSLFEIDNSALRFSTIKKTEDRDTFIVRVYNPTNETQTGSLRFFAPMANAWLTNLNENRQSEIILTNSNEVSVSVEVQKIISVEIETL